MAPNEKDGKIHLELALEHLRIAYKGISASEAAPGLSASLMLISEAIKFLEKHKSGIR